jgi:uncharacterized protein YndB with AHSA1/START domain
MTSLTNQIAIAAPRRQVWAALTQLDQLAQYDPGVQTSRLVSEQSAGIGAQRCVDLRPAGWFAERVAAWEPEHTLAFELLTCSLPVSTLRHDYTLTEQPGPCAGTTITTVTQVMTYRLKYGTAGRLLDAAVMRRQWDRGIKAFLAGLRHHVEAVHHVPAPGEDEDEER